MKLLLLFVSAVVLFSLCYASTTVIWGPQPFTIEGSTLYASLEEFNECEYHFLVKQSGFTVINKQIDLIDNPTACQTIPTGCTACLTVTNLTRYNSRLAGGCVTLDGCGYASKLPCFNDTTGHLAKCLSCPNGCSGNGQCENGKCQCNPGWAGNDCSDTQAPYSQCVDTGIVGNVCVNLEFKECEIVTTVTANDDPKYSNTITAKDFPVYFVNQTCTTVGLCSACLSWKNLVLNSTYMSGCPSLSMSCGGMGYNYPFPCFSDDNLVPSCFGDCPKNCSYNGVCNLGQCNCTSQYQGPACDFPACPDVNFCSYQGECVSPNKCKCSTGWSNVDCSVPVCDNNCAGHGKCTAPNVCNCDSGYNGTLCQNAVCTKDCLNNGVCVKGKCQCTSGWEGADCSEASSSKGGHGVIIGVVVALVVLGAVGGGAFFLWRRRSQNQPHHRLNQFDDGLLNDSSEN